MWQDRVRRGGGLTDRPGPAPETDWDGAGGRTTVSVLAPPLPGPRTAQGELVMPGTATVNIANTTPATATSKDYNYQL